MAPLVPLMTTPHAEIHEAVKYRVRRALEHEAPLERLRKYLDLLELNGWPAEAVSDIGNASCRILAIILESDRAENRQDQQEGLASFLLRHCHQGDHSQGPPQPRSGNRRHQPQHGLRSHPSRRTQRSGETRHYSPQSESG